MTTTPTQLPVPSEKPQDLKFNAGKIDEFVTSMGWTYSDRFGVKHYTIEGLRNIADQAISAFGYITIDSFQAGAQLPNNQLTLPNQVLRDTSNGEYYRWDGVFPKTVTIGSTPITTGGIGIGAWLSVGDAVLRTQISDPDGAAKYPELQIARWRDEGDVRGWGAKGDGVTNDTLIFSDFETDIVGRDVDLHGRTYLVDAVPSGNRYFNGKFLVSGITHDANYILGRSINKVVTLLGDSGSLIPSNYSLPETNRFTYRNMSFFSGGAGGKLTASGQSTGIGADAMGNTVISFDNTAIGECALQNVQSTYDYYTTTNPEGTRNVAFGGNTLQFLTTGWNNVALGRNAGVCAVNTVGMVAIGNGAFGGIGESGWYDYIENFCPNTSGQVYSVALGQAAGAVYQGIQLTAVGGDSGKSMRKGIGNSLFGRQSGSLLESLVGLNGKQLTTLNLSASYVKTGNNMVITVAGHNTVVGGYIAILPTSGPADVSHNHVFPCQVIAVSGDNVTVQCPYTGDGTGSVTVGWTVNTTDGALSQANSAFGDHSIMRATVANDVAANGNRSGQNATSLTRAVLNGSRAGQNATTITDTVLEGTDAGNNATAYSQCTGLGASALRVLIDGSIPSTLTNSTAVGYNARVSGDNQFQIGNSTQSPYAYSAVQLRSDGRDKRNIRDTELGIEFILGLRPVQYNANPRDAYYEEYSVQVGIDVEANPVFETRYRFNEEAYLAGEKSGGREHQGLIYQEVDALAQALQTDFAGLHNHSRRGGCDVGSIGYQQLDGPMIKTLHQIFDVIEMLIDDPEKAKERIKQIRASVPLVTAYRG